MPKKRTAKIARPAPTPSSPPTGDDPQRRRDQLRERYPSLFSRVVILEKLTKLQEARGGEFEQKFVFVHMPDHIFNIRRIGEVDIEALTVAFEVYEHHDIVPGIVWVPLDHIWWIGTTDDACGAAQVGLRTKENQALPPDSAYQLARLKLAGLRPRN
jgi:hypothetical protein